MEASQPAAVPPPSLLAKSSSDCMGVDGDYAASCVVGRRYTGCVSSWGGARGFLSCTLVPGSVSLDARDLEGDAASVSSLLGCSVNFELGRDHAGAYKAVRAKAFI